MHESASPAPTTMQVDDFGTLADGRSAKLYTLSHPSGLTARVTNFGATLVALEAPDRDGKVDDLVLGYDSVSGYESPRNPYFGATVGRFGNRIANGRFALEGKDYTLARNNDPGGIPCHLHGGEKGFSHVLWDAEPGLDGRSICFTYHSRDDEEGYPGNLIVKVTYTLTDDSELIWEAIATTDATTIINLVQHSYWNLSGDPSIPITDHELQLHADHFIPTNSGMIPTGELAAVAGTPMDFTTPCSIGARIEEDFEALVLGRGYDHCYVLSGPRENGMTNSARLTDPKSGRVLEVSTNQPAVQFYTANWVDESDFAGDNPPAKRGRQYGKRSACCLETENFPDAPNQPNFPSPVLKPDDTYRHVIIYRFSSL
ncbi:MAG: aldose epimerase family protein [Verrucomicrobiota bacterium]